VDDEQETARKQESKKDGAKSFPTDEKRKP